MAFMLAPITFAAATLTLPENLQFISLNQQAIKTRLIGNQQVYQVDAGKHVLGVRYHQLFEHHDNSHDILKSDVIFIETPQLQDGQTYHVALIDAPQDFDDAQKYKNKPQIGLYNANQQLLSQQTGVKVTTNKWLGTDLTTPQPITLSTPSVVGTKKLKETEMDQKLIQAWQQATKIERQAFMSWLAEQTN